MKWAIKAAVCSDAEAHRVGAAIMKGKTLISVGWNSQKTHPKSTTRYQGHHAEFDCIIGNYKYELGGTSIFVVRLTPGGRLSMARPCGECLPFIRAAGISKVFYTNHNGEVERI